MEKEEKTKDEKKITKRHQGNRLPIGKIKTEIIIYVLSQPDAVSGTDIKEHLRIKYNIRDERNIRQHFEDLLKSRCIEKIKKAGYENKWDITKIKILKNISHGFSEIKLNKYEKSINIVLKELGYRLDSPNASRLRSELFLSPSFFKICLENNIEALYALSYKIYKFGEGSDESKIIIKYTNDVYNEFSKEVSAKPNIWLSVYSETANDPLKSSFYQNFIKSPPDFEFSEEVLLKIFNKMPVNLLLIMLSEERPLDERYQIAVGNISVEVAEEIVCHKLLEEVYGNLMKMPRQQSLELMAEVLERMSEEIYSRLLKIENWEEVYNKILKIGGHYYVHRLIGLDELFNQYFNNDILESTVSSEDKEFVYEAQKITAKFVDETAKDLESAIKNYDNFFIEYLEKLQGKNGGSSKI